MQKRKTCHAPFVLPSHPEWMLSHQRPFQAQPRSQEWRALMDGWMDEGRFCIPISREIWPKPWSSQIQLAIVTELSRTGRFGEQAFFVGLWKKCATAMSTKNSWTFEGAKHIFQRSNNIYLGIFVFFVFFCQGSIAIFVGVTRNVFLDGISGRSSHAQLWDSCGLWCIPCRCSAEGQMIGPKWWENQWKWRNHSRPRCHWKLKCSGRIVKRNRESISSGKIFDQHRLTTPFKTGTTPSFHAAFGRRLLIAEAICSYMLLWVLSVNSRLLCRILRRSRHMLSQLKILIA